MPFLYHGRPPAMRGETLYPLNQLESIDPVLYDLGRARYKGREAVLVFHTFAANRNEVGRLFGFRRFHTCSCPGRSR
jgi:hypothetical protein